MGERKQIKSDLCGPQPVGAGQASAEGHRLLRTYCVLGPHTVSPVAATQSIFALSGNSVLALFSLFSIRVVKLLPEHPLVGAPGS